MTNDANVSRQTPDFSALRLPLAETPPSKQAVPLVSEEATKCPVCDAEPEPGFLVPLCARCREAFVRRPIPIGIKVSAVIVGVLIIFALVRIPSTISAAVAFDRGQEYERKLQFSVAAREYQKSLLVFPRSDLVHARLFAAAFKAKDMKVARRELEFLKGRKMDPLIAAEVNALLKDRYNVSDINALPRLED